MERIHKKSALAETAGLLLAAQEQGVELAWERYERQLPLCGFTGNGLSCRKCFQGPCRINPFGDEPSQGVCGADRDQIVMEHLFQATLEGVMETARAAALLGIDGADDLPDIGPGLPPATRERLSRASLLPVRRADLFRVQNAFFSHKGYLAQTLRDLTRLGLIHYGLLMQAEPARSRMPGPAWPVGPDRITVLIVGQAPVALIRALEEEAGRRAEGRRMHLLAAGGGALSSVAPAADHGSPELALTVGPDAVVISPNGAWPGLEGLAKQCGLPVVLLDGGKPVGQTASEALEQACRHAQHAASAARLGAGASSRGAIFDRENAIQAAVESGRVRGVAVLLGEANVQQSFFERTLALMEAALGERALILLGGELGSQIDLLEGELHRRKAADLAAFASALEPEGLHPVSALRSAFDIPRLISLVTSLADEATGGCPAVIAFPEFFRTSTWATVVSFLSLGLTVQVGTRLPFWGSPALTEALRGDWPAITGGRLLAAPALPEAAAQAQELAALLRSGRGRQARVEA